MSSETELLRSIERLLTEIRDRLPGAGGGAFFGGYLSRPDCGCPVGSVCGSGQCPRSSVGPNTGISISGTILADYATVMPNGDGWVVNGTKGGRPEPLFDFTSKDAALRFASARYATTLVKEA